MGLKLTTHKIHKMMLPKGSENNPALRTLHWPGSPALWDDMPMHTEVEVKTKVTQDAVIFPIEYLKDLIKLAGRNDHKGRDFLLSMVNIHVGDQKKLDMEILHTEGSRGHHLPDNYMETARKETEEYKKKKEEEVKQFTEKMVELWNLNSDEKSDV